MNLHNKTKKYEECLISDLIYLLPRSWDGGTLVHYSVMEKEVLIMYIKYFIIRVMINIMKNSCLSNNYASNFVWIYLWWTSLLQSTYFHGILSDFWYIFAYSIDFFGLGLYYF